jgi:hypothetical protein
MYAEPGPYKVTPQLSDTEYEFGVQGGPLQVQFGTAAKSKIVQMHHMVAEFASKAPGSAKRDSHRQAVGRTHSPCIHAIS